MSSAKIAKNGMINLPVDVRKRLGVQPGDRVAFIETDAGFSIVPIKDPFELVDPKNMEKSKELIKELQEERKNEAW